MKEAHDLAQPRTAFLGQRDSDTEGKPSLLKIIDRFQVTEEEVEPERLVKETGPGDKD